MTRCPSVGENCGSMMFEFANIVKHLKTFRVLGFISTNGRKRSFFARQLRMFQSVIRLRRICIIEPHAPGQVNVVVGMQPFFCIGKQYGHDGGGPRLSTEKTSREGVCRQRDLFAPWIERYRESFYGHHLPIKFFHEIGKQGEWWLLIGLPTTVERYG